MKIFKSFPLSILLVFTITICNTSCEPSLPASYVKTELPTDSTYPSTTVKVSTENTVVSTLNDPYATTTPNISRPDTYIFWTDVSGSMANLDIPRLLPEHLEPVIERVLQNSGRLIVGSIGDSSKDNLAILTVTPKYLPPPIQRDNESADQYRKRLEAFLRKKQSSSTQPRNLKEKKEKFLQDVKKILDYNQLEGASDVQGACEITNLVLNEPHPEFANSTSTVVFCTDGINSNMKPLPTKLKADKVVVVTRLVTAQDLQKYKPSLFISVEGAIDHILN